ncbi:MAG: cell wall metabolism sensor histidine kinase WalK [Chloroflexi bacterium]|nr:cell wall metabolism sensor histidine kinase WalK [Chloroflexota bacterium]
MYSFHERHLALQQERNELIAALSAVGEGVAIVSEHSTLTYANPSLWSISATLSHTPQSAASPEELLTLDGLPEAIEHALTGKSATCTLTTDRGEAHFQVRTFPLTHSTMPPRAAIIFHDLSEAQRLDRVRQEFVANASHELLTPIGTVRALADSLARGGLDDPKVTKRFLRQLRTEADRLAALARELLELTQAQADELRLELSATDVNAVVRTVIDRFTPQADAAHISLCTNLSGS